MDKFIISFFVALVFLPLGGIHWGWIVIGAIFIAAINYAIWDY